MRAVNLKTKKKHTTEKREISFEVRFHIELLCCAVLLKQMEMF